MKTNIRTLLNKERNIIQRAMFPAYSITLKCVWWLNGTLVTQIDAPPAINFREMFPSPRGLFETPFY